MAYTRNEALDTHKDYSEAVSNWEYYIRSYNGGYDYMVGQYLNRYNLELDNEFNQRLANTPCDNHCKNIIQIYSSYLFRVVSLISSIQLNLFSISLRVPQTISLAILNVGATYQTFRLG
jgi:tRNA U54 and U55 pseudouridine synthase Pus10